jgi:hypothetical protein
VVLDGGSANSDRGRSLEIELRQPIDILCIAVGAWHMGARSCPHSSPYETAMIFAVEVELLELHRYRAPAKHVSFLLDSY